MPDRRIPDQFIAIPSIVFTILAVVLAAHGLSTRSDGQDAGPWWTLACVSAAIPILLCALWATGRVSPQDTEMLEERLKRRPGPGRSFYFAWLCANCAVSSPLLVWKIADHFAPVDPPLAFAYVFYAGGAIGAVGAPYWAWLLWREARLAPEKGRPAGEQ